MRLPRMYDKKIEEVISLVLRGGVLLSAVIVLGGGIYELVLHGNAIADYRTFRGQPSIDRIPGEMLKGTVSFRARSIVLAGILVLIATPVARVAFSLFGFALERDGKYVAITGIVLAVLLYSFISGAALG